MSVQIKLRQLTRPEAISISKEIAQTSNITSYRPEELLKLKLGVHAFDITSMETFT